MNDQKLIKLAAVIKCALEKSNVSLLAFTGALVQGYFLGIYYAAQHNIDIAVEKREQAIGDYFADKGALRLHLYYKLIDTCRRSLATRGYIAPYSRFCDFVQIYFEIITQAHDDKLEQALRDGGITFTADQRQKIQDEVNASLATIFLWIVLDLRYHYDIDFSSLFEEIEKHADRSYHQVSTCLQNILDSQTIREIFED